MNQYRPAVRVAATWLRPAARTVAGPAVTRPLPRPGLSPEQYQLALAQARNRERVLGGLTQADYRALAREKSVVVDLSRPSDTI